jgi:hypothetical protein
LKSFFAVLNGGQEVPSVTSTAFGVAFLTFNPQTKLLCYGITVSGTLNEETGAEFAGPARPAETGGLLFPITPVPSRAKNGCVGPIVASNLRKALMKGRFYINIRTQDFPAGEIRGQVVPTGLQ